MSSLLGFMTSDEHSSAASNSEVNGGVFVRRALRRRALLRCRGAVALTGASES